MSANKMALPNMGLQIEVRRWVPVASNTLIIPYKTRTKRTGEAISSHLIYWDFEC